MNRSYTILLFALLVLALSCGRHDTQSAANNHGHAHGEGISITLWTSKVEIFAELDPPVVEQPFNLLIHLTRMNNFQPVPAESPVRVLFETSHGPVIPGNASGRQDGIFEASLTVTTEGPGTLFLEVTLDGQTQHIQLATIQIGTRDQPGYLLSHARTDQVPLPHRHAEESAEAEHQHGNGLVESHKHQSDHRETDHEHDTDHEMESGVPFLKEQQWAMAFRSARVGVGTLPHGISSFGRVQARSGYDIILTAPVDGIVTAANWPTDGMFTSERQILFHVVPRISDTTSLSTLHAQVEELKGSRQLAADRLERLERLLETGTVSRWEVENVRSRVKTLGNQLKAADSDLQTARSLREQSRGNIEKLAIHSPFAGQVVHVRVTPGQYVTAGTELIHIVQERPIQLELAIPVQQTHLTTQPPQGLYLRSFVDSERIYVQPEDFRVVARTPGVDPETGKVSLFLEVDQSLSRFPLNAVVEAELLLEDGEVGIVIPTSALIDDAGTSVVYRQLTGEAFLRTPVRVLQRRGNHLLVTGLHEGDRIVTRGGPAIRRVEMIGSGNFNDHGHGH